MDEAERRMLDGALKHATQAHTGPALDAALAEIAWHEALEADPRAAITSLFERQGETSATSSALDFVLGGVLGVESGQAAVVLPPLDGSDPPGREETTRVVVNGIGTSRLLDSDVAVVVTPTLHGDSVALLKTTELTLRAVGGMDPRLELVEATGTATPVSPMWPLGAGRWEEVTRRARLALGHELVGAAAAMLELARVHALERIQFGRPIAAFQAVRHRLADTLVAVESARTLLDAAWEDGGGPTAAMAKAVAGRTARTAARHCQQVLAGMGFTTEHPFHRYVRRVLVLDEVFGSSRSLTAELGREVLASRALPRPLPL